MRHFCTYFDSGYLTRGIALYRSLERHGGDFTLWTLCMDQTALDALERLALPRLRPVPLARLEDFDPELAKVKAGRSKIEYYFTCSPCWPLQVLKALAPDADVVTYLDADLFFFSSAEAIFEELGAKSILITAHRFPPEFAEHALYGKYNVGVLSFRRDRAGLACLERWREQCIEWCFDREENGRYADQKYLDDWPTRFPETVVASHPGINLAPWNVGGHRIGREAGRVVIDGGKPLVVFHFHGLRVLSSCTFDAGTPYLPFVKRPLRAGVYAPYLRELRGAMKLVARAMGESSAASQASARGKREPYSLAQYYRLFRSGKLMFCLS